MKQSAAKQNIGKILLCAAMGLLLFWVLESAVARRVGFDLFLPVQAGRLLPGRVARLCAWVVVCFAAVFTGKGRRFGQALNDTCQKDRYRWLVSAVVTALFFVWALRVTVLSYMTIDDVSFLRAIAKVPEQGMGALYNALAHSAPENASSLSVLLAFFIGQLYRIDPDGYWYLGYHLAVLFLSVTVIGRCILVKTSLRRWPVWAGCTVFSLLCGGVFLYTIAKVAFTVTAAVAGTAAAALVLCRHHEPCRSSRILTDVLSGLLMLLCCLQRRATGYCLLCFWALAAAYQIAKIWLGENKTRKGRLSAFCAVCVLIPALIAGAFAVGDRLECDDNFREAEYYRSQVVDYIFADLTYDQYARAGVCEELATMIHGWYFMDEQVNTELFRELTEIYYADQASMPAQPLVSRLTGSVVQLAANVRGEAHMLSQLGIAAVLLLLCMAGFLPGIRRCWPELLCSLCAVGGAVILLLYLTRDGRFPIRVFLVISIPTVVMLLLMGLSLPKGTPEARGRGLAASVLAFFCGASLAALCAFGVSSTPNAAQAVTHADVFADQIAIEAFLHSHSDATVVTSIYDGNGASTDPLHTVSSYPENLVIWGYWGDTAKPAEERLYADAFFRDDVYFMTDNPATVVALLQYLSLDYGPVQALQISRLASSITVYKISRVLPPETDYTGWYERNGMTYYFRDGRAVTGEESIDGAAYSFAATGSKVRFLTYTAEGDFIYTTAAYSLIS